MREPVGVALAGAVASPEASVPTGHDPAELRRAFGLFATGVAVVTARRRDGTPLGMTINSFASLSLSPALLLWSLSRQSRSHADFLGAEHFAIHVLEEAQQALCRQFAASPERRFDGVELESGLGGLPLLRDCLARYQCRTVQHHEGGDHHIIVGEVVDIDSRPGRPLVFFQGQMKFLR